MIKNESHYRKRQTTLEEYKEQLNKLDVSNLDENSIHYKSNRELLESLIEEIQKELQEYEAYKLGYAKKIMCNNFGEISNMLIQARIAQGLSHQELAEKADLHAQQIQKYEANDYQEVKFGTLTQIASALGMFDKFKAKANLAEDDEVDDFLLPENFEKQFMITRCLETRNEGLILKFAEV